MALSSHRTVTSLTPYQEVFGSRPGTAMFPLLPSGEYDATVVLSCFEEWRYTYLTMQRHDIAAQYFADSGFETRPGAHQFLVLFSYSR